MTAPHRIRTLRLNLRADSPEDAFRLRQAVTASVQSAGFATGLETLLDHFAPGGTEYRIDRLEVPVTGLTAEAWKRDGPARLLAALESALTQELRRASPATGAEPDVSEKGNARISPQRTPPESVLDAFAGFLRTGTLPWWAAPDEVKNWETTLPEAIGRHPARASAELASALAQPEASRRLVWQVSWKTILRLLETFAGEAAVGHVRRWETVLVQEFRSRQRAPATLRETVETQRAAWVTALAARNWRADAAWLHAETRRIEAVSSSGGDLSAARTVPEPLPAAEEQRGEPSGWENPTERGRNPAVVGPEQRPGFSEKNARTGSPESAGFAKTDPVLFIANAGLVLLHPFVAPLLAELDFLENGRFRSERHRHRAVHLLAHLAGQEPFPAEPDLLLPKLLLGLLPETPVRRRVRLSRTEKAEARNLLGAVVEHWSALRNTSPEALQAEFLHREGRLERRADDWTLTVEQRASDVLLGRLPWGVSLVRLPWMPGWLHVTWA